MILLNNSEIERGCPLSVDIQLESNLRIIAVTLRDPLTVNELSEIYSRAEAVEKQYQYRMHFLVDLTPIHEVPQNVIRMHSSIQIGNPDETGYTALVVHNAFVRSLADMIMKVAKFKRARFFTNEAEARAWLEKIIAEYPVEIPAHLKHNPPTDSPN